jgi:hypothetical protein
MTLRRMAIKATVLVAAASLVIPGAVEAQEPGAAGAASDLEIDTEHIFGFGEGSDVGAKGELEVESFTIGSFGAAAGNFSIGNETSFRYSILDGFRLSVGGLFDEFNLRGLPSPGARNGWNFSGLITEARWNLLDWRTSPVGLTFTIDPDWRRTDPGSGRYNDNVAITTALLIDTVAIPGKLFVELNLIYSPSFLPLHGKWRRNDSFTAIVGGSYAIGPAIFIGAELRHENIAPNMSPGANALFFGPHIFLQPAKNVTASFAWAFQLPDLGASHADLTNFERYEAGLRVVYGF